MKNLIGLIASFLIAGFAFADDPGDRDSLIIETVFVDLGSDSVDVRIYVTCDDSVGFYNMPLTWNSLDDSSNGIYPIGITYYYPIIQWDHYWDSIFVDEQFIRMVGMVNGGPADPPLYTVNNRWHCWTLHFVIDSSADAQIVTIDTTYDPVNGSLLFGTYHGLYSFPPVLTPGAIFYGITSDANDGSRIIPEEIALLQNYPNPFNASTTVEYDLAKTCYVFIEIYDLLGRKIEILLNDHQQPGRHRVIWDASDYSSGIYFYRIEAGKFIETRRMLLLK